VAKRDYICKLNKEKYEFQNIVMFGIICSVENVLFPWLKECCDCLNIDFDKETLHSAFYKVSKLLNMNFDYDIYFGENVINREEDYCCIGIPLSILPENQSIKRLKIDFFEDFQRVGMISDEDVDLKYVNFHSDIMQFLIVEKDEVLNG